MLTLYTEMIHAAAACNDFLISAITLQICVEVTFSQARLALISKLKAKQLPNDNRTRDLSVF